MTTKRTKKVISVKKPIVFIGECTINKLRNGEYVVLSNVMLTAAPDLKHIPDLKQTSDIDKLEKEKKDAENISLIATGITLILSITIICLILVR